MRFDESTRKAVARVQTLFADIDDTISTQGKITARAYDALWRAHDAGLGVVPVTGRPAGWCDHIARMWPVEAVIGENGGLYFRMRDDGMQRVFMHDAETRAGFRRRLTTVRDEILGSVPGCGIASDQTYREYDVAIDFCEDVSPLSPTDVQHIVSIFEAHGAHAKVSSIHVNGWYGDFDKLSMVKRYVREVHGRDLDQAAGLYAFIGDSPNDEPMFLHFPLSFGVANVRRFLPAMQHGPRFLMDGAAGAGFAQLVDAILAARLSNRPGPS
jgi:HAD superfamily hydrolase (TIGR01484 family)